MDDEMHRYGQYCPIARSMEVLGDRWSVLLVRDLLPGPGRFNDLARGNPGLSRTLLSKRLRQLERAGIVAHVGELYQLTPKGQDLEAAVIAVGTWGARWMFEGARAEELDPKLLMWWIQARLDFSHLPERRVVLAFEFRAPVDRFWIVHDARGLSVCTYDPGFGIDATIEADTATLYDVWFGKVPLRAALGRGDVVLHGPRAIVRALPDVLVLNPIAPVVAAMRPSR